ncbi:hypothetical protein N9057_07120 [Akkermansiaceae bacterium]|nr:hypothetical protein [Akkermansiaceae bacterium]
MFQPRAITKKITSSKAKGTLGRISLGCLDGGYVQIIRNSFVRVNVQDPWIFEGNIG